MPTEQQVLAILATCHRERTLPWPDLGDALQLGRVRAVPRDRVSVAAASRGAKPDQVAEVAVLIRSDLADGTIAVTELDIDAFLSVADALRARYRP